MSKFRSTVSELKPNKKIKNPSGFQKYLIDNKAYIDEMKAYLTYDKPMKDAERVMAVVPAGSGLDKVIQAFQTSTDVPLELCLMTFLHYVSGYLLKAGVTYDSDDLGDGHIPFIWNIVLADSGAGKTFTVEKIAKYSDVVCNFPEVASGAKFFEELKRCKEEEGYALWFLDECAQFLKGCQQMGHPLFEVKNYLLKMYSQGKITRSTKKAGTLEIEKPVMSILAVNTIESFLNSVDPESMTDGFMQRFGCILAKFDPERPTPDYPTYSNKDMDKYLSGAFDTLNSLELNGKAFRFNKGAELLFKLGFQKHFTKKIPVSFYRRNLFRAFSYAVIYHVILGNDCVEIGEESMAWGLRMTELHLQDMVAIIGANGFDDVKKKTKQVVELEKRLKEKGRNIRPSDVSNGVRGIENKEQAIVVMKMAGIVDNK